MVKNRWSMVLVMLQYLYIMSRNRRSIHRVGSGRMLRMLRMLVRTGCPLLLSQARGVMTNRISFFLVVSALFCLPLVAQAQSQTVTGTVTSNEDGQPLPGATVVVPETTIGTATDVDGQYELEAPADAEVLRFTYVGFEPQEVAIEGRSVIDVALVPDYAALDEVVVIGYGTQIETEVTGSIASVSAEEIENLPVTSFEQALQGRAAGVFITGGSGKLGQGIQVRIRGASSVSADNEPLYVVDGMPITTVNLSGNDAATNPLAHLSISDIESIQILKDASAAAIYGARASNGVVIITTKGGFAGGTQFTANLQRSWSGPTNTVDMLNAEEYVAFYLESARNRGEWGWENFPQDWASEQDAIDTWVNRMEENFDFFAQGTNWRELDVRANWQEQAFRDNAGGMKVDLSARGGSEETQFFASGSYNVQDGILVRDSYDRMAGRLSLDHHLSDDFRVGGNVSLTRVFHTRLPYDNAFATPVQLIAQLPISPIYVPDPSTPTVQYVNGEGPTPADCVPGQETDPSVDCYYQEYVPTDELNQNTLYLNNLLYKDNARFETTTFRSLATAYMEADLLPSLSFRSQFSLDLLDQNEDAYSNSVIAEATNGSGFNSWDRVVNYNIDGYFTYNETFFDQHDLEGTAGTIFQSVSRDGAFVSGAQYPNDESGQIDSAAEIVGGGGFETGYRFLAYFARANYAFQDRYLLKLSGRYEGSSRFGRDNQYGFFPAVSAGWILSEETFLDDSDAVSFLKLRASYGLTGNAGIDNFAPLGLWGATPYGGDSGLFPSQIPNPSLQWERSAQFNVGLDYGFFNNRISGAANYYIKNTDNLLLNVNVPATTGYLVQTRNVGSLENRGFEFLINTSNLVGDFNWSSSLNFSINRNKITDLNDQIITGGFINRAVEGEPIGVFFGYEYAGVDPETGDALYYVNEMDEEGNVIDSETTTNNPAEANRVVIGNPNPDFIGGFGNQFGYKGFELGVFFQFSYGHEIYDGGGIYKSSNGVFLDNQIATQLDAWQESGDQTDVPEARFNVANGIADSDRWLYDASYLRLKYVTPAYNLPRSLLGRLQIQSARVYLTGINLLTFTDYLWFDPEANSDYTAGNIGLGNVFYTAPQPRTISGGIQFTF